MALDETVVDPLHELHGHLDQALRVAMAGGLQVAYARGQSTLAEMTRAMREAERADQAAERRRRAERAMAAALWSRAMHTEWWEQATPDQVSRVYEAAISYAGHEPGAADALVRMDAEIDQRYAIAVDAGNGTLHATRGPHLATNDVAGAAEAARQVTERRDEQMGRWREAIGPELADSIMGSKGWESLERRLTELEGKGTDSAAVLQRAVEERSLRGARDAARVLAFRLSPTASSVADKGAGVESEGPEVARLINDTLRGNRKRDATRPGPQHDREPWSSRQRHIETERGLEGPEQSAGR